jgi:Zn-dependent protease/CBS domain-containing protein
MQWAIQIGRVGRTRVKIHLTFLLLLCWAAFAYWQEGGPVVATEGVLFVSLIFFCVLLHEFGHILVAAKFGIRTTQVTLLPIGGVAQMERIPERPLQEIAVAIAGPAVNVAIGILLWGWLQFTGGMPEASAIEQGLPLSLPTRLLALNFWLALFNLIPAFPMDGGRILRAVLAFWTPYPRATLAAARIGQCIAIGLGFMGLFTNPMLVLIGLFIYFSAAAELNLVQFRAMTSGLQVASAMLTQFQRLPLQTHLEEAAEMLIHSAQRAFPVIDDSGSLRGMLTQEDLLIGLRSPSRNLSVADVMHRTIPTTEPDTALERALKLLGETDCSTLPVLDPSGRLVGLFSPENAADLVRIRNALAHNGNRRGSPPNGGNGNNGNNGGNGREQPSS